jgi:methylated-DNA-[protein]-cysteine S-methyltransferase
MDEVRYRLVGTSLGAVGLVWARRAVGVRLQRITLPATIEAAEAQVRDEFPGADCAPEPGPDGLAEALARFVAGEPVQFDLAALDLDQVPAFVRAVLLAQCQVPRGRVTTYGRLAAWLGAPAAARAVGNALARNPFPLAIPCHRTLRSDGRVGGFGGGPALKRTLLELEGVRFGASGRARAEQLWP